MLTHQLDHRLVIFLAIQTCSTHCLIINTFKTFKLRSDHASETASKATAKSSSESSLERIVIAWESTSSLWQLEWSTNGSAILVEAHEIVRRISLTSIDVRTIERINWIISGTRGYHQRVLGLRVALIWIFEEVAIRTNILFLAKGILRRALIKKILRRI